MGLVLLTLVTNENVIQTISWRSLTTAGNSRWQERRAFGASFMVGEYHGGKAGLIIVNK